MVKDAFMKLSELFSSHLSFIKNVRVDYCKSKEILRKVSDLLHRHVSDIDRLLDLNKTHLTIDLTDIEKLAFKLAGKSKLNPMSEAFRDDTEGKQGTSNLFEKKSPFSKSVGETAHSTNPSLKFVDRLLSSNAFEDREKDSLGISGSSISRTPGSHNEIEHGAKSASVLIRSSDLKRTGEQSSQHKGVISQFAGSQLGRQLINDSRGFMIEEDSEEDYEDLDHEGQTSSARSKERDCLSDSSRTRVARIYAESPSLRIDNIQEFQPSSFTVYGVHNVVKVKKNINLNGFVQGKPRSVYTLMTTIDGKGKDTLINLAIASPVFNYINFKGQLNFYFCENGSISINYMDNRLMNGGQIKHPVVCSKDTYKTWYTVGKKDFPSTGRGICIGNNKLYFIDLQGDVMMFDLQLILEEGIASLQTKQAHLLHQGPAIDLHFTRRYLLVLCENDFLDRINTTPKIDAKSSHSKNAKALRIDLLKEFKNIESDSHFTTISSSVFEVVIASYSVSRAFVGIHRLNNELQAVDQIDLVNQNTHIHSLKLLIRKKCSYFLAVSRTVHFHILAVMKQGLLLIQANAKVCVGPIDGLCVVNEDELLVYEGTKSLLNKVTLR